jgi:hypothetical protein
MRGRGSGSEDENEIDVTPHGKRRGCACDVTDRRELVAMRTPKAVTDRDTVLGSRI